MTVKQLKKLLEDIPDNMVVVTDSRDHAYRPVDIAEMVESAFSKRHCMYSEYYSDEDMTSDEKKVEVFRIN